MQKKNYRILELVDDLGGPTLRNESFQDVSTSSKLFCHDTLNTVHTFPWIVLILGSWKIWLWNSLLWKFFVDTLFTTLLSIDLLEHKWTRKKRLCYLSNIQVYHGHFWQFPVTISLWTFSAHEFRGNAKRIQHFDFSFEEDLMQAFQNRSRIWIILIFANFRSKFGFGQKLGDIFRASELRNNRTWTKHFDFIFEVDLK